MTRPERLRTYFDELATSLPDGLNPAGEQAVKRRKLGTLLQEAGAKNSSSKLRDELAKAARGAGLETDIPLDDPGVGHDAWIRFSRTKFAPPAIEPPSESDLREWILHNIGARGPLARLYDAESEFTIPGTRRRIDILAKERSVTGRFSGWVVIEVEKSSPTGCVSQLARYIAALRACSMADGYPVRGMAISPHPVASETELFNSYPDLDLSWYHLESRLKLDVKQPSRSN